MVMETDKKKGEGQKVNDDESDMDVRDPTWAWVALIGIYYSVFLVNGVARSYGILYVEFLDMYGQGPFMTGWVSSTFSISHTVLAPVFGFVADRWNVRWFVVGSGLLGMSGLLMAAFAPNLKYVIAGYGILTGTANTIAFSCCISMMNKYFIKRRGLANGIAFSGSGLGASTLPFLYQYMSSEYSVRGAMIIVAGLWVNLCVTGALLRPVPKRPETQEDTANEDTYKSKRRDSYQLNTSQNSYKSYVDDNTVTIRKISIYDSEMSEGKIFTTFNNNDNGNCPNIYSDLDNVTHVKVEVHPSSEDMVKYSSESNHCNHDRTNSVSHLQIQESNNITNISINTAQSDRIEDVQEQETHSLWKSLCKLNFLLHCLFWFAGLFGFFGIVQFIPPHIQDLKLSKTQASTLLSIVGGVDLVARLLFGAIGDLKWVNKKLVVTFNFLISGIATILFSSLTSWPLIAGYAVVLGLCGGSFMVYMGPLVIEAIGVNYVGTGIGISSMLFGLANTLAPLTFGAVREWAGSYRYAILVAGGLYLFGTLVLIYSNRKLYISKAKLFLSKL